MKRTLFVKYNRTRKPEYQIRTRILEEDGIRHVEKLALLEYGESHIRSFEDKYQMLSGQNPRLLVLKPEIGINPVGLLEAKFPFLTGETMDIR